MKINIYLLILLFVLGGCNGFLEESSLDEVRPSTVEDLEQLLLGEGYPRKMNFLNYVELLTDDIESDYSDDAVHSELLQKGVSVFTWQADMYEQLKEKGALNTETWQRIYQKIKGCNVILDMLDDVSGSESNKLNQRGQALALRSFYYFMLVNTYGQPYNAEGVDVMETPGVPLILESAVKDEFPSRASVGAVYRQIEKDLLESATWIDQYGQGNVNYKVTPLFVHTLLSRMYLYMENWEKAKEHASNVIRYNPRLRNLMEFATVEEEEDWWTGEIVLSISVDRPNGNVFNYNSPEFIWGYSDKSEFSGYYAAVVPGVKPAYHASAGLMNLYVAEDLRPLFYFERYFISFFPMLFGSNYGVKCNLNSLSNTPKGMRVAEAYLNRAEANIRLFLDGGGDELRVAALADLNYLRSHRFISPYEDVDIADGNELLEFYKEERRRELCFEEHRWFDLRRYGMPKLTHVVTISEGQPVEYTLPEKDPRYVLPIAREVLDKNPALRQNP